MGLPDGWISKRLKKIRKMAGLKQEELAQVSKVPISTIQALEAGRRKDPRISTMSALSESVGCSLDYFVGEVSDEEE